MTRRNVFTQILSEVSEKPTKDIAEILDQFLQAFAGKHKFDEVLPDQQADQMLQELREEKEGIRAWLIQGGLIA